jgi:phosphohistidine phosphatase SixA
MKLLFALALCALGACSTNSINPAFKGSEADQAIQKARSLPGFNAANFLPGPATEKPPLLRTAGEISAALAKGGYIIYMRHGRTQYEELELERDNRARGTFDLNKCETQRSLSNEGRSAMKVSGMYFRQANVPIAQSFVSRYCRAIESAAYYVEGAQKTDMLSGEGQVGKDPAQKARTIAFLSQVPAPGKNTFMMAHGGIFWEATGYVIQEEHAVVLDPKDLSVLVARISPEEWPSINTRVN